MLCVSMHVQQCQRVFILVMVQRGIQQALGDLGTLGV